MRKVAFYEQRHQRTADLKILISPFIHPRAEELAQELGIETGSWTKELGTVTGNAELETRIVSWS